jgi:hypothetical protein
MSRQRMKPSRWYYGLAVLVLLFGWPIAVAASYPAVRGVPAAIKEAYDLNRLTQVVVPGSAEITLSRTGAYGVYYEYRSVVNGVEYAGSQSPPSLECSLTSEATGRVIPVVPDFVGTNRYDAGPGRRAGVLIMSTTVDEPGSYAFSCRYTDDRERPSIVLAFGQNIIWELLGLLGRTACSLLCGLAVLGVSGVAASAISIVVTVKRWKTAG